MLKVFIMIKYFISFQFWQILLLEVMFEQDWFRISKMEKNFPTASIVRELNPDHAGESRALYHSATSPSAVVDHEWYWVVDWQAAFPISWSSFPVPLQHCADRTGSQPVNNSIPLIINHSGRGRSWMVECSTLTGVIRDRFPDDVENYFPFWKFKTNPVKNGCGHPFLGITMTQAFRDLLAWCVQIA